MTRQPFLANARIASPDLYTCVQLHRNHISYICCSTCLFYVCLSSSCIIAPLPESVYITLHAGHLLSSTVRPENLLKFWQSPQSCHYSGKSFITEFLVDIILHFLSRWADTLVPALSVTLLLCVLNIIHAWRPPFFSVTCFVTNNYFFMRHTQLRAVWNCEVTVFSAAYS